MAWRPTSRRRSRRTPQPSGESIGPANAAANLKYSEGNRNAAAPASRRVNRLFAFQDRRRLIEARAVGVQHVCCDLDVFGGVRPTLIFHRFTHTRQRFGAIAG